MIFIDLTRHLSFDNEGCPYPRFHLSARYEERLVFVRQIGRYGNRVG